MSDKDSENHVFSYMDGIPVKISEKYKPPRKIVLPVGFQNRLLQPPVCPDYDFQLEHDVLDKLEQWRSSRAAEKEQRKQRLAEEDAERNKMRETMQEIEKTMHELSTEEGSPVKNQSPESQSPAPVSIQLQQPVKVQPSVPPQSSSGTPVISEVNPILRPIPFKHQVVNSQMNNNKPISAFNLSDFEADTSSPFDNMELKTINDLEELAQVLQPSATSQTQDYYLNTRPSEELYGNAHHQTVNCHAVSMEQSFNALGSNNIRNDAKHGVNYQPHVNGFTSNYDYNSMQSYHPHPVIPHLNQHGQAAAYSFAEREHMSQPSDISFSYSNQDPQHQLASYYGSNAWSSVGYQPARQPSYGAVGASENKTAVSNQEAFKLLPSSSIDRTEERSPDEKGETSVSHVAQQLSDLMRSRAARHHQKPSEASSPENSSSVQSPTSPTEPDPFESLQSESQFLVQKIVEMGFPRARVARACQKLGSNDKKIVEFLLSLESLLDAGYQEGRAEHALSMHNQDLQATTKYLQVESQLLDLGFPADRVSEALVKFNCDRDQALEFLIS